MRDELMSEIIKLEWDMFSHVSNVGGPASCQMRPDTFKIMRKSQAATWSDELLASYLEDLKAATREGRNIMTEKYARMMESTFPEEYRKLAASLPSVDKETLQKIEEKSSRSAWDGKPSCRPLSPAERQAARCAPAKTLQWKPPLKRTCGEN